jgi:hypothetical protein
VKLEEPDTEMLALDEAVGELSVDALPDGDAERDGDIDID